MPKRKNKEKDKTKDKFIDCFDTIGGIDFVLSELEKLSDEELLKFIEGENLKVKTELTK